MSYLQSSISLLKQVLGSTETLQIFSMEQGLRRLGRSLCQHPSWEKSKPYPDLGDRCVNTHHGRPGKVSRSFSLISPQCFTHHKVERSQPIRIPKTLVREKGASYSVFSFISTWLLCIPGMPKAPAGERKSV